MKGRKLTEEQVESVLRAIDTIDSLIHALKMRGLSPEIHVEGLRGELPRVLESLREVFPEE